MTALPLAFSWPTALGGVLFGPSRNAPAIERAALSSRALDEALRDSRLLPEDLLGGPGTDRPFFLRPEFGRSQR